MPLCAPAYWLIKGSSTTLPSASVFGATLGYALGSAVPDAPVRPDARHPAATRRQRASVPVSLTMAGGGGGWRLTGGHPWEKGAGAAHGAGEPADDEQGQVQRPAGRGFSAQAAAVAEPRSQRVAGVGVDHVWRVAQGAGLTADPGVRRARTGSCPVVVTWVGMLMPPSESRWPGAGRERGRPPDAGVFGRDLGGTADQVVRPSCRPR
ncbi:hypothetical protein GCM10010441_13250 [Kitasatospora paracochleata]